MRFLIDENLPESLCAAAVRRGYEASWVHTVMGGAPDVDILERLRASAGTLVTRDVRFANLVLFSMTADTGLEGAVLIREQRLETIEAAWGRYLDGDVAPRRTVVVIDARGVRIRSVE